MSKPLRTADLNRMSPSEQAEAIAEFIASRPSESGKALARIEAEIAQHEIFFGMSSETMLGLVHNGLLKETVNYCHWMMLLKRRDRLAGEMPQ